jgi:hypothetical protein
MQTKQNEKNNVNVFNKFALKYYINKMKSVVENTHTPPTKGSL